MSALQNEIDKLKTLKESYSNLADSVANQKETNENILTLLSQFGESVLQEKVTVVLNCQDNIAWGEYAVEVTMVNGSVEYVPITENGTCSFSVRLGQEYSVQLPVIGAYIAPQIMTYTAMTSARQIYWSYTVSGLFGMDELGRRYTIEQIEALDNKSIIMYGAYTDPYLENYINDDGSFGAGIMWKINTEKSNLQWAMQNVEFDQNLLPFLTTSDMALPYCDGFSYTKYIMSEGVRLAVETPAATWCNEHKISLNGKTKNGFLISYGQLRRLANNISTFNKLYSAVGLEAPPITASDVWTSIQSSPTHAVFLYHNNFNGTAYTKIRTLVSYVFYKLN